MKFTPPKETYDQEEDDNYDDDDNNISNNNNNNIDVQNPPSSSGRTTMIGATIQTRRTRRAQHWRGSDITLDSFICNQNENDVNSSVEVNYQDLINLKIKIAELQTELQVQEGRATKYKNLVARAEAEKNDLEAENMALRMKHSAEVTRLRKKNKQLRGIVKDLLFNGSDLEKNILPLDEECQSHPSVISGTTSVASSDEDLRSLKSDHSMKVRGSNLLLSKLRDSFRIDRPSVSQNDLRSFQSVHEEGEPAQQVIANVKGFCKTLSTSFQSSLTAMTLETDMNDSSGSLTVSDVGLPFLK